MADPKRSSGRTKKKEKDRKRILRFSMVAINIRSLSRTQCVIGLNNT